MKTIANTDATDATTATQDATAAPEQPKKKAAKKNSKHAAKPAAKKNGKPAKAAKLATKKAAKAAAPKKEKGQPREGSKKQIVLDLLNRKDGATMAEIAKATGWQNHSIRGFISGSLMKKMQLPIASLKNNAGERVYRIER
jgi:hypothetical protein